MSSSAREDVVEDTKLDELDEATVETETGQSHLDRLPSASLSISS
jgi:hypothetical protein